MPSVNGYVAFFDVSVSPSNSDEDDDDDNDDEDGDDEGEEKEEKYDEERLAAFRLYLSFFSQSLPFFDLLPFLSVLFLAIHLFISCSGAR